MRVKSLVGFDLRASQCYLSLTVNSVEKQTSSYPASDFVEVNELVDFEVGLDARHLTILLYTDTYQGQAWFGSAEVSILAEVKGANLDKSYSADLIDQKGRFINGRLGESSGKVHLEVKLMSKYIDELNYKLTIIEQELKDNQEQLEFTKVFLETCVVPFPNLDKDRK